MKSIEIPLQLLNIEITADCCDFFTFVQNSLPVKFSNMSTLGCPWHVDSPCTVVLLEKTEGATFSSSLQCVEMCFLDIDEFAEEATATATATATVSSSYLDDTGGTRSNSSDAPYVHSH